jgi:hypothetical protein
MAKVSVSVEVSKEAHELAVGVKEVALAVKQALADGFQVGQDIPAVIGVAIGSLAVAVAGVEKLGEEIKEDPAAFSKALALPMADLVSELAKKAPQA